MEQAGQKTFFAVFKKKDGVNDTCVMRKITKDERNHRNEFCYRRFNMFNDPDFDSVLDYDDLEAGMDIESWWPYRENANVPDEHARGRFRETLVIQTEVQHDDSDDKEEDLKDVLLKYKLCKRSLFEFADWEGGINNFLQQFTELGPEGDDELKKQIAECEGELLDIGTKVEEQMKQIKRKKGEFSQSLAWGNEMGVFANSKI